MIRFIPSNTCKRCDSNNVPDRNRTIILLEQWFMCGHCGNKFNGSPAESLPGPVGSILRSLVEHGLFRMDAKTSFNPLSLWQQMQLDFRISPASWHMAHRALRPACVSHIARSNRVRFPACYQMRCAKPATLVAKSRFDKVRPSLTMTELGAERNVLRFEHIVERKESGQFHADCTRVEFGWSSEKVINAVVFFPLFSTEDALNVLKAFPRERFHRLIVSSA